MCSNKRHNHYMNEKKNNNKNKNDNENNDNNITYVTWNMSGLHHHLLRPIHREEEQQPLKGKNKIQWFSDIN